MPNLIYIRKLCADHDMGHEINIGKPTALNFFGGLKSGIIFTRKNDPEKKPYKIDINSADSDPRLGNEIDELFRQEGGKELNDLFVICKQGKSNYEVELIKPSNPKYGVLNEFYELEKKDERHTSITAEETPIVTPIYVKNYNQIIYYGVPGCGKSYKISHDLEFMGIDNSNVARVVFHPEFTNSDFVGQIIPTLKNNVVEYKFNAGEFTKILRKAYENPKTHFALIIEEINRGNAAAIFGDLFQLLDRFNTKEADKDNEIYDEGWSSYPVMNDYINAYIRGVYDIEPSQENRLLPWFTENTGIRLPSNLSLFATMNTSDQNVFKLDNAFKRRWQSEMIPNEFDFTCDDEEQQKKQLSQCNALIEGFEEFTWGSFRAAVNSFITDPRNGDDSNSFSDKQLGTWFVKAEKEKDSDDEYFISKKIFLNKVLEYLWDDVFTEDFTIFNSSIKTLAQIIKTADISIFNEEFLHEVEEQTKLLGEMQINTVEKTKDEIEKKEVYFIRNEYLTKLESFAKEINDDYELNFNCKGYVGIIKKDAAYGNNFVFFEPNIKKNRIVIYFYSKINSEIENLLQSNFGDFKKVARGKNSVTYGITMDYSNVGLLEEKSELLKNLIKQAHKDYFDINPVM